jgi:uncharacterized protein YbaA (DUF1428 family)
MAYVDGFVTPVQRSRLDEYKALSAQAGEVWREHGALSFRECIADDVPVGKVTSFPQAVQLQEGEVVFFSYITYPSREVRDSCNEKVMADPRLAHMMDPANMPFDGKRMFFGGFEVMIDV